MTATAAERGAELTKRLLAGMDGLLRRTLPEDVDLQLVRAAGLWPVLADPVQLESAVLNIGQLADAARGLRPDLKVLFTSGYTENAIVHHGRLDRGVHLLSKPCRAVDLARKVRTALG